MDFKVYAGAWSKMSDGTLTGMDTMLSARVITESENDKDYTFEANVVVKQGSGCVIVNHTVDENYN